MCDSKLCNKCRLRLVFEQNTPLGYLQWDSHLKKTNKKKTLGHLRCLSFNVKEPENTIHIQYKTMRNSINRLMRDFFRNLMPPCGHKHPLQFNEFNVKKGNIYKSGLEKKALLVSVKCTSCGFYISLSCIFLWVSEDFPQMPHINPWTTSHMSTWALVCMWGTFLSIVTAGLCSWVVRRMMGVGWCVFLVCPEQQRVHGPAV